MIPYGKQHIDESDINAVVEVLKADFLTQGPVVPRFEELVSKFVNCKYATAVNSATSALHIACLALDLGPGDYLWTSPITFAASANCGLYCGAKVDFVDIDENTYNLCPLKLEEKLIAAKSTKKVPKVLVVVHLTGQSCDMEAIHELSKKYNFRVIEDASHAVGAKYKNENVGGCHYSDITVFSFHPVKMITTGEGGMALTNDPGLHQKNAIIAKSWYNQDPELFENSRTEKWYYEQVDLGFNYRMTDIEASLGISQLSKLDSFVNLRRKIASRYYEKLGDLPLKLPFQASSSYSCFHLFIVRLDFTRTDKSHCYVFNYLRDKDIAVNLHYIPVHLHPFYKKRGFNKGDYPLAEQYFREAISLPIYTGLSTSEQDYVISMLSEALN